MTGSVVNRGGRLATFSRTRRTIVWSLAGSEAPNSSVARRRTVWVPTSAEAWGVKVSTPSTKSRPSGPVSTDTDTASSSGSAIVGVYSKALLLPLSTSSSTRVGLPSASARVTG